MPWFRVDDSFHSHPKIIEAGNEAIGLYVRSGSYAAEHLTDGFIPESVVLLYGSTKLADKLVQAKLWRRVRGGWLIPDYLDYNPSKIQVKQERKNAAERQRRRRDAMVSRRDSRRDTAVSHTTPTRPVPVLPPNPPQAGGIRHDGTHQNCRQCGTNPRGEPPPTRMPPRYQPPNGHGRVPSEDVADLLASTRQAITQGEP